MNVHQKESKNQQNIPESHVCANETEPSDLAKSEPFLTVGLRERVTERPWCACVCVRRRADNTTNNNKNKERASDGEQRERESVCEVGESERR